MYDLKTVLPQFDIKLPTCMYPMKVVGTAAWSAGENAAGLDGSTAGTAMNGNINTTATATMSTSSASSNVSQQRHIADANLSSSATTLSSMRLNCACVLDLDSLSRQIQKILRKNTCNADAVASRQDKVLAQLNELKTQMAAIRATLGLCQKGVKHTVRNNGGLREEPLHDVVINGHPNFIPYALLALKNAWKDLFTIDVKTFTHSTMTDIGPEARDFEQKLATVPTDLSKPKINITLIWKNCEHTEMISSPTMYVPIYGEVNIIRYLGRVGPEDYRYENSVMSNEIDAVLDICYQLLRCTTAKSKAAMIRSLNNRLEKQKFFAGDEMSIADIGVDSSLKRMPSITEKELTPTLRDWRKRVQLVTKL